jgi:hypothetical protein
MAQMAEYLATLNPPAHQRFNRNDRNHQRSNRNNHDRNHRNRGPGRPPSNNQPQFTTPSGRGARTASAPITRDYCWTHGACAHASAVCNTQLPGHQITATFANMQGGNTNGCFWLSA